MRRKQDEKPAHNPRLKAAFLEIVGNQLKANNPPQTRETWRA
jgi:hypothetical protein